MINLPCKYSLGDKVYLSTGESGEIVSIKGDFMYGDPTVETIIKFLVKTSADQEWLYERDIHSFA